MTSPIPVLLSIGVGTCAAAGCAVCALRPEAVASYLRRRHLRAGKFVQNLPFTKLVRKPWYLAYVRFVGIGGVLCAVLWCYRVVVELSK